MARNIGVPSKVSTERLKIRDVAAEGLDQLTEERLVCDDARKKETGAISDCISP